jgi:serine/threonine protein kinase
MPIPVIADEHPDAEELRAFGLGRLGDQQAMVIERHIEHCDQCCEFLRDIEDDSLVETLRDANRAAAAETIALPEDHAAQPTIAVPPELQNHPRYRIKARLGMGGMGIVYRAEHRLMQRDVAIKVIHPRLVDRPQAVTRFRHEVQAAARLNDEHVVRAYDAEQVDAIHFLVMEYVEGESLDRHIAREGMLPVHLACSYAKQAALGLEAAHARGMVHRDIKPQNILINANGCAKVADFGLSRFVLDQQTDDAPRLTTAHVVLGTPDYMAPEQARESRSADIRSDIYSLGCTLYHMLTGQPPFPTGTAIEKLALHMTGTPQPIAELRPGAPKRLANVITRMMARDPATRFQSPAEVAAALEPFTRPLPTAMHSESATMPLPAITPVRTRHGRPKHRRFPAILGAALSGTVVVGVLVAVANWQGQRVPPERDSVALPMTPTEKPSSAVAPVGRPRHPVSGGRFDDFSGSALAAHWKILDPPSGTISVEHGGLVMIPNADTGWYNGGHGMLVTQRVAGDFVATARLKVHGLENPQGPPREQFNSAGLLARDPGSGPTSEAWIMISLGQQASFFGTKTEPTWQSESRPQFQPASATGGELRLARMGKRFSLLRRLDGETEWTLLQEHQFPSIPDVLEVGPAVNAYRAADIRAVFDSVRITVPESPSDLYRVD